MEQGAFHAACAATGTGKCNVECIEQCNVGLQMKHRDVGLMVVDTSKPGWIVLHADCNNPRIDSRQAEGQSLWDKLKVPDVVSTALSCLSCGHTRCREQTSWSQQRCTHSVVVADLTNPHNSTLVYCSFGDDQPHAQDKHHRHHQDCTHAAMVPDVMSHPLFLPFVVIG